jgi:hypothetical protein
LNLEKTLLDLALEREAALVAALDKLTLEHPGLVLRELRAYMGHRKDSRKIMPFKDDVVRLTTVSGGVQELACPSVEFSSGAWLEFYIKIEPQRRGWLVKEFEFNLFRPRERKINMILIHLNAQSSLNPRRVPRCHLRIGDCPAHIPFPIMPPLLMLDLICTDLEADVGI